MRNLKIIFEDPYLLVIDKPSGLVSTPSQTQSEPTLADILNTDYGIKLERGGLVHRLDKDTSGLILVAKNQAVFDKLQAQFAGRQVRKEYLTLVHGIIKQSGIIDAPIERNPIKREKFITVDPADFLKSRGVKLFHLRGGQPRNAVTEYEPIDNLQLTIDNLQNIFPDFSKIQMRKLERMDYGKFTLLKCIPRTGRTHQIRVHLKYVNHPIVSDEKYGGRKMVRLDHRWCPRQFLHAGKLKFKHPVSGEVRRFESKLPDDLEKALNMLSYE